MGIEQSKRNPNFFITYKSGPNGIKREYKLLLPSDTPKEWMKKLNQLDHLFNFPPNIIANIEIFQYSGMGEFIAAKVNQYEELIKTGNDEIIEQLTSNLVEEISDQALNAVSTRFNLMRNNKSDLVVLEALPEYYLTETDANAEDSYFGKIKNKLAAENIDNPVIRAQNIAAYWNLNEMSLVMFKLLTGRKNLSNLSDNVESSDSLEKTLFGGSPSTFLSSVAYLITSFETLLTLRQNGKLQKYNTDFFGLITSNNFLPILRSIVTMEFSETYPNNNEYRSYFMSHFSQLMAYLSDIYYKNLLNDYGIVSPVTTDPKDKKIKLNQLKKPPGVPIENFVQNPSHGLVNLLATAGLPETMLTLDLLIKSNKISLQSTFKSGFRIILDEHPEIINYLGQLRNLRPDLEYKLDIAYIYNELLKAKLNLPEYRELAGNPEFYLQTRNYFKFRIVAQDGQGFDNIVNSVIRDLIQDRKQLEEAPMAKDAPWILEVREKIREKQKKNLKEVFTLFVNPTATTRVIPFSAQNADFYQKMVDGSPTEIIRRQYDKGGRAMFFIRFNVPIDGQNYPVEIQVVPESVEQQLHQQREKYLIGRIFGYLGTTELIQEFANAEEIGNYVV